MTMTIIKLYISVDCAQVENKAPRANKDRRPIHGALLRAVYASKKYNKIVSRKHNVLYMR